MGIWSLVNQKENSLLKRGSARPIDYFSVSGASLVSRRDVWGPMAFLLHGAGAPLSDISCFVSGKICGHCSFPHHTPITVVCVCVCVCTWACFDYVTLCALQCNEAGAPVWTNQHIHERTHYYYCPQEILLSLQIMFPTPKFERVGSS